MHLVQNHTKSLEGETTSEGYHPRVPSQNTNWVFTLTIHFCCMSQPVSIWVCVCFCMLHLSNEDSCSFCVLSAVGEGPKERPFFLFFRRASWGGEGTRKQCCLKCSCTTDSWSVNAVHLCHHASTQNFSVCTVVHRAAVYDFDLFAFAICACCAMLPTSWWCGCWLCYSVNLQKMPPLTIISTCIVFIITNWNALLVSSTFPHFFFMFSSGPWSSYCACSFFLHTEKCKLVQQRILLHILSLYFLRLVPGT